MALSILTKPDIVFSSALGDVWISTDEDFADIELTSHNGSVLLAERLYAFGGRICLYDISSLIEMDMRASGSAVAKYTLSVYPGNSRILQDSCSFSVVYCDRWILTESPRDFLKENFLTTLTCRRVAPVAVIRLCFYAEANESTGYYIAANYRVAGTVGVLTETASINAGETAATPGVVEINLTIEGIAATLVNESADAVEILSFSVFCGNRAVTFFVDRELEGGDSFTFRNCFNAVDSVVLPSVTTTKSIVDRSEVMVNGAAELYDQSLTRSYEVETGPLTSDEAEFIDQLFASASVYVTKAEDVGPAGATDPREAIITESTCEAYSGTDKLSSVKFTWRYRARRPLLSAYKPGDIFSEPYNPVFS